MAAVREFYYPSSDGIHQVHAMAWEPEGEKRGVVQIVHGLSEYVGRYDRFARFLAEHGFAVYGADHLGHGLTASDGEYTVGYAPCLLRADNPSGVRSTEIRLLQAGAA